MVTRIAEIASAITDEHKGEFALFGYSASYVTRLVRELRAQGIEVHFIHQSEGFLLRSGPTPGAA